MGKQYTLDEFMVMIRDICRWLHGDCEGCPAHKEGSYCLLYPRNYEPASMEQIVAKAEWLKEHFDLEHRCPWFDRTYPFNPDGTRKEEIDEWVNPDLIPERMYTPELLDDSLWPATPDLHETYPPDECTFTDEEEERYHRPILPGDDWETRFYAKQAEYYKNYDWEAHWHRQALAELHGDSEDE